MAAANTSKTRAFRSRSSAAATRGRSTLARVIGAIAAVVALILIVGIVLTLLKANESNAIVGALLDAAGWLAGPFEQMFTFDRMRTETAVNWGVAAVVWYALGRILARIVAP